ncbi:MAG: cytochrome c-type biogenesis protein [bacterium]
MKIIVLVFLCLSFNVQAIEPREFATQEQREIYLKLTEELRCLVCQNQNIADSEADLAGDLRQEVYEMVIEGQNKKQIKDFLVARYGDFVLYRPPLQENTIALWFLPAAVAIIAIISAIIVLSRRKESEQTQMDVDRDATLKILEDEEP